MNETSDCDEQLLIFIPLNQKTRIKQIALSAPSTDSHPKTIKIFKNKKDLDFDSLGKKKQKNI